VDAIKKNIEELGHNVTNIRNIKKRDTKMLLNIFYVENNNKDICEATHVLDYTVKVELSHPKCEIPQYIKFRVCQPAIQKASATENASSMQAIIQLCPRKVKSKTVKCMLCEGNHPPNYKDCTVKKDISLYGEIFPDISPTEERNNKSQS